MPFTDAASNLLGWQIPAGFEIAITLPGSQFVQNDTEREHIAACIQDGACSGLFGTHVGRGTNALRMPRAAETSRHAKINQTRLPALIEFRYQYIGRLQIAVQHAATVRMFDRPADALEQDKAHIQRYAMLPDKGIKRLSINEFHGEKGRAIIGGPGIKQLGDSRMRHACQRLPLYFKQSSG
ncbi:MAG: hypothetical protein R3F00_11115 [Dokdonella sp.]